VTNDESELTSSDLAPRSLEVHAVGQQSAAATAVTIADLVVSLGSVISDPGDVHLPLTGVRLDSRRVRPGDLFVALPGMQVHGAQFAQQAIDAGAVAILTDPDGARLISAAELHVATLIVPNPRHAMAVASAMIYGCPSKKLSMLGVTGTNGKTTTTLMIEHALTSIKRPVATIGTLGTRMNGSPVPNEISTVTTPESPQLQELLARYLAAGGEWVAMEVSSHALALERVSCTIFDVAGFTNLGRDHLDFHRTMTEYFEAKAKLFTAEMTRSAVLNIDDPAGVELARRAHAAQLAVLTTGRCEQADVRILDWRPNQSGSTVRIEMLGQLLEFQLGMPGEFNVRNAATTLAMLALAKLEIATLLDSFADVQIPGRMQPVPLAARGPHAAPQVFVDFGHTPQAITAALQAAAAADGRLIAVLGAGGDRDPEKRGPMGAAAASLADLVIVTDDNPRSEPPAVIRQQIIDGAHEQLCEDGSTREVEIVDGGDRAAAIKLALQIAEPQDRVVILGKGHEQTQEIAGVRVPFDDVTAASQAWVELGEQA